MSLTFYSLLGWWRLWCLSPSPWASTRCVFVFQNNYTACLLCVHGAAPTDRWCCRSNWRIHTWLCDIIWCRLYKQSHKPTNKPLLPFKGVKVGQTCWSVFVLEIVLLLAGGRTVFQMKWIARLKKVKIMGSRIRRYQSESSIDRSQ